MYIMYKKAYKIYAIFLPFVLIKTIAKLGKLWYNYKA